jgi:hypothetical protein
MPVVGLSALSPPEHPVCQGSGQGNVSLVAYNDVNPRHAEEFKTVLCLEVNAIWMFSLPNTIGIHIRIPVNLSRESPSALMVPAPTPEGRTTPQFTAPRVIDVRESNLGELGTFFRVLPVRAVK